MGRLLEHKFRIVVLLSTTACLSMMLANILTLNFTILCMTEEKFHWENFTIDLGIGQFFWLHPFWNSFRREMSRGFFQIDWEREDSKFNF